MIGVGPLPMHAVVVFSAALMAWMVSCAAARRLDPQVSHHASEVVLDMLLWGLLGARLGYVMEWWPEYAAVPLSVFTIGDGGFSWWSGLLTAIVLVGWRTRNRWRLGVALSIGICAGLVCWFLAGVVLGLWQRSTTPLPDMQLAALDKQQSVNLSTFKGRPVVLNLWASWCPPCRREMSAFEKTQKIFPAVDFVMINQGETTQQARAFLEREGLDFKNVLIDPSSSTMQVIRSRGLPTTLFFDAQGLLVHSHMGEMTMASLKGALLHRLGQSTSSNQHEE